MNMLKFFILKLQQQAWLPHAGIAHDDVLEEVGEGHPAWVDDWISELGLKLAAYYRAGAAA